MPNHVGVAIFVESTDGSAPVQFFRSLDVSLRSLDNCSSGCPKSGFRGSGCRISAGFRISAHSPIEKPRSILLRFLLDLIGEDSQKWRKPAYPQIVSGRNIVAIYTKRRRLHEQQFATDSLRSAIAWFNVAA